MLGLDTDPGTLELALGHCVTAEDSDGHTGWKLETDHQFSDELEYHTGSEVELGQNDIIEEREGHTGGGLEADHDNVDELGYHAGSELELGQCAATEELDEDHPK